MSTIDSEGMRRAAATPKAPATDAGEVDAFATAQADHWLEDMQTPALGAKHVSLKAMALNCINYGRALATPPAPSPVAAGGGGKASWGDLALPYTITHSPAIKGPGKSDEAWLLNAMDAGHGLTSHPTLTAAKARAEQLFGPEPYCTFTIKLCVDRSTQVKVQAAKGTIPAEALADAIAALEAERTDLGACPVHTKAIRSTVLAAPPAPNDDLRAALEESEPAPNVSLCTWEVAGPWWQRRARKLERAIDRALKENRRG